MRLGRIIGQWRRARKVSVRHVAKSIGVDYKILWRFEQGQPVASGTLSKLLQWLLVEGSTDPVLANLVLGADDADEEANSLNADAAPGDAEISPAAGFGASSGSAQQSGDAPGVLVQQHAEQSPQSHSPSLVAP